MPDWRLKAFAQGLISALPNRQAINGMLQKTLGGRGELRDDFFHEKYGRCLQHLAHLEKFSSTRSTISAVELGTGKFPVVPLGLALNGASVTTIDLNPILSTERVLKTIRRFRKLNAEGVITLPQNDALEKLNSSEVEMAGLDAIELLQQFGITVVVGDARHSGLATGSVDLVCSNNTFEHIPEDVLAEILAEFSRVVAPTGVISHHIDMVDHYSFFDDKISQYNFLKYSESQWRWFNGPLQYQNRLRVSDFRELYEKSGFDVVHEESIDGDRDALLGIRKNEKFTKYSEEDLLVVDSILVGQARQSC